MPRNGDVNPYGVAVIPRSAGHLRQGNVLVSNFNDKTNVQGTGTTIVQVTPHGQVSLFAKINRHLSAAPGGVGPDHRPDGAAQRLGDRRLAAHACGKVSGSGCLIVLDRFGHVRETFTGHGINGPWDMTSADFGGTAELFVTNVLNGTVAAKGAHRHRGTVIRIFLVIPAYGLPYISRTDTIGSGFAEHLDPAALRHRPDRCGPRPERHPVRRRHGGEPDRGHPRRDVPDDRRRHRLHRHPAAHLNGPLGLVVAPGGNILTVNSGDGNLVEVTPSGFQVAVRTLDRSGSPPGAGALFGLAVKPFHVPSTS